MACFRMGHEQQSSESKSCTSGDFVALIPRHLMSSFSSIISTAVTRGHRLTINLNVGRTTACTDDL